MKQKKSVVTIEVILILAVVASVMFIGGCGTTQMVNLWKDPSYQAAPLQKIMVVAMRKDPLVRRMWEDSFVSALEEDRTKTIAISSYHFFPDQLPDTVQMMETTQKEGIDGVIMVARVEHGQVQRQVPGYISELPYTDYGYWWGYYWTNYLTVYHPAYTETLSQVSVRTDLLLVPENGQMVWSGTSEEIDPSSPDQFRKSVAERVIDELMKVHFVR
jgi:hypothetical protein